MSVLNISNNYLRSLYIHPTKITREYNIHVMTILKGADKRFITKKF